MIASVSQVSGTSGQTRLGKPWGRSPMSATVLTGAPVQIASAVSTTIATSGAGTAVVSRGSR
ncbi:hypothetical protein J2X37_001315 [Croceicoccus sp. BE223]|nr:hypothetical protein [Croceicoccus sp. BE223]